MDGEILNADSVRASHVRYWGRLARHLENGAEDITAVETQMGVQLKYQPAPGAVHLRAFLTTRTHDCEISLDAGMTWMLTAAKRLYSLDEARQFLADYAAPRFAAVLGTELAVMSKSVGAQPMAYPPALERIIHDAVMQAKAMPIDPQ